MLILKILIIETIGLERKIWQVLYLYLDICTQRNSTLKEKTKCQHWCPCEQTCDITDELRCHWNV